jgi:hypothetical protein
MYALANRQSMRRRRRRPFTPEIDGSIGKSRTNLIQSLGARTINVAPAPREASPDRSLDMKSTVRNKLLLLTALALTGLALLGLTCAGRASAHGRHRQGGLRKA